MIVSFTRSVVAKGTSHGADRLRNDSKFYSCGSNYYGVLKIIYNSYTTLKGEKVLAREGGLYAESWQKRPTVYEWVLIYTCTCV